ncbi:MAG TPA: Fic family protein [Tepidisphaeraceae bacterium]|jgi:Fic family protein|nr:Fic family protein [Tepidisphaeraceae bacterium]
MMTLRQFSEENLSVPSGTAWLLADIGQAMGMQALFTKQSPQRLKVLLEHALIESAVSSNRIEGVEVDQKRIGTLIFGKAALRDRDEEEVRGYRDALNLIHTQREKLPVSESTILQLHQLARGEICDAGKYKDKNGDIIERFPDGRTRVRFRPTPAKNTPAAMKELLKLWNECLQERWVHPLVAMCAFNLDFLCIHPFRDGNGRSSRLLLVQQCYHLGLDVGRYISLERVIEQNKERYYETLQASSVGWHDAKHDPWKYINFLLFILKDAFKEFESRLGRIAEPKGAKAELVRAVVARQTAPFRLSAIEHECPGVGRDWIQSLLREMKTEGLLRSTGHGAGAKWLRVEHNKGSTLK